jgi:hypothetical protein
MCMTLTLCHVVLHLIALDERVANPLGLWQRKARARQPIARPSNGMAPDARTKAGCMTVAWGAERSRAARASAARSGAAGDHHHHVAPAAAAHLQPTQVDQLPAAGMDFNHDAAAAQAAGLAGAHAGRPGHRRGGAV